MAQDEKYEGGSCVADIVTGRLDAQGAQILTVYAKVRKTFAVYGTRERVALQYADDDALGSDQRKALSPLTPLRGEINGLVDGWREGASRENEAKAKLFDRRVADALVVALQGDIPNACSLMAGIKTDVLQERTSVARTDYIIAAAIASAIVVAIASLAASPLIAMDMTFKPLWAAAGFGALGGLFSIALAIRDRSVLTDLQRRDNVVDAVLRIVVACISAVVLTALLRGNLVRFGFGGGDLITTTGKDAAVNNYVLIAIAFAAGFSERLVGNLLARAYVSGASAGTNPIAGSIGAPPPASASGAANEKNPLGSPTSAAGGKPTAQATTQTADTPDVDDLDGCLSGASATADQVTADVELPEALGGVEAK